jgi:hypothetical protein
MQRRQVARGATVRAASSKIAIYPAMNGSQIDIYLRRKADAKFEAAFGEFNL